jgi:hypothetical protein
MILRGIVGVLFGVGYGALVSAVMSMLTRVGRDPRYPGPLIPDANEMARLVTMLAAVVTGACGVVVGLAVGLSGVGRGRAAAIGCGLGLVLTFFITFNSWSGLLQGSWHAWRELLTTLVFLPCGLALTGVLVSDAVGRLESFR